jgi:hypothetical protein
MDEQRRLFEADILGVALESSDAIMRRIGGLPEGVLVALTDKGALIEAVPMPPHFGYRTAIAEACRGLLLANGATAYAFAHEVWTRRSTKPPALNEPVGDFAEMPDSEEAVVIVGQTSNGNFGQHYNIVRSRRGAFKRLRAREEDGGRMIYTGIWTDLLYRQQAS